MSIYSGSSPFSRGKLGGAKGIGMKMSRGGAKKKFKLRERIRDKVGQSVQRTGTAASSTVKGTVTYTTGIGTSGQGLIKSANNLSLTSTGGLGTYDALGIVAAGGSPIGFITVTCGTDFTDQPQVANGVSDLLGEVFGEQGKHARSAVGVAALPGGMCFEAELILKIN